MDTRRTVLFTCGPWESRAALLEGDQVVDVEIEHPRDDVRTGDVYLGRIRRVMPGLDAAFVDLGTERPAYLPLGKADRAAIGVLRKGQPILTQVARAPMGGKGARLTAHVALPGRHWVLATRSQSVTISKRIGDPAERQRLTEIAERVRPNGAGLIARTAARNAAEAVLTAEADELGRHFAELLRIASSAVPPSRLHQEVDLARRWLRDRLEGEGATVAVDDAATAAELRGWLEANGAGERFPVELHAGPAELFEAFGVERAIRQALARVVRLPSGGQVSIDRTEALTAIDVNTGGFVGRSDLESTVLHTNLEAAVAIAHQVRLRNLGGILVIDFIDMAAPQHRERVLDALRAAFASDTAPTEVLPFTPLGLVQVTRKRTRPDLAEQLSSACAACGGSGRVPAVAAVAARVLRSVAARHAAAERVALVVRAAPAVVAWLRAEQPTAVRDLEKKLGRSIVLRGDLELVGDQFVLEP